MRILIAAGGTGGHIYPALALAKEIQKKDKRHQVLFIGSNHRMEKDVIPSFNYPFYGLDIDNFKKGFVGKLASLYKMNQAYWQCRKLIKQEKIEVVMGFGNYITLPVLYAAHHLQVKTLIHEQNALPGKANLLLSPRVDATIGSYVKNKEYFKGESTYIYGNPRAQEAAQLVVDTAFKKQYGFAGDDEVIVIFMGSLGSSSVNAVLLECLSELDQKGYKVLYATGKQSYQTTKQALKDLKNIRVEANVDGLQALAMCHLAITRAGATTLAELAALGVPAILIPSPYVPDNGQFINAKELVEKKAACLLEEKELSHKSLTDMIIHLMQDDKKRQSLKENIKEFAYPLANDDIIKLIDKMIGE